MKVPVKVFDGAGKLLREETMEVPNSQVARDTRRDKARQLLSKAPSDWTSTELREALKDLLVELVGD